MILEFIRLFSGFFLGGFATIINIKQTEMQELVNFHVGIVNSVMGLIIGVATLVFLIYQIKKIRRDLKLKAKR